jgi:hypothetical protein
MENENIDLNKQTKKIKVIAKSFLVLSLFTIAISLPVCIFWGMKYYQESGSFIFFLVLMLSIFLFICSIGLLKQKSWARISIVSFLSLVIIWSVYSTYSIIISKQIIDVGAIPIDPESMISTIKILSFIFTLVMSFFFGWMIKILLYRSD